MPTPSAFPRPEFQHLLRELEAMGRQQFEQFLVELEKLRSRKAPEQFDPEEQRIIARIKSGGPDPADRQQIKVLSEGTAAGELSEADRQRLEQLLTALDEWTLERAELLVQLMERWQQPIEVIKRRIGLVEPATSING